MCFAVFDIWDYLYVLEMGERQCGGWNTVENKKLEGGTLGIRGSMGVGVWRVVRTKVSQFDLWRCFSSRWSIVKFALTYSCRVPAS